MEQPTFDIIKEEELLILKPIGEIDAGSSPALYEIIETQVKEGFYKILVDCSELDYLSSAGIGVFISHIEIVQENNGSFAFCNMNENIFDSFKALGLLPLIVVTQTMEEAKKSLNEDEFFSTL